MDRMDERGHTYDRDRTDDRDRWRRQHREHKERKGHREHRKHHGHAGHTGHSERRGAGDGSKQAPDTEIDVHMNGMQLPRVSRTVEVAVLEM